MALQLTGVSKTFGGQDVLRNITLQMAAGEFLTLLGPSGCGKSTLLRLIAGLETADQGLIRISGQDASRLPAGQRGIGFVFQNYALFRHMTVAQNIAFGLTIKPRQQRWRKDVIKARVDELITRMRLEGLAERYPEQLSGGQKQRVALARALAVQPRLLLLDEPFAALDAKVRRELRVWLRGLQRDLGLSCVLVTHDQEEAWQLSDRVALLNHGSIEQIGTPQELSRAPQTAFAREFLTPIATNLTSFATPEPKEQLP